MTNANKKVDHPESLSCMIVVDKQHHTGGKEMLRMVDIEYIFQVDCHHYSVPAGYGNRNLRVEAFVDRIEVYDSTKLLTVYKRMG
jgi:hypothetical protein